MQSGEPSSRYTFVAIALHWVIALAIVALMAMGLIMTRLKTDPLLEFQLYQLHKSIGITVLVAVFLRLAWRFSHRPPSLPMAMPPWEKRAAPLWHALLYVFQFALPLTGWALVSASVLNIPTVLYGVLPWPDLPVLSTLVDKAPVEALLKQVHAWGAYALLAAAALHTTAALRHHFWVGDDVLLRVLPRYGKQPSATTRGVGRSGP